jgi:diacylglycerol kinase (ATP)
VVAWVIAAAMVAINFMGTPGTVTVGARTGRRRVLWALANNGQLYGLLWRVAPDARMDDGLLDLAVFEGYGVFSTIRHFAALTLRQYVRDPTFQLYRGRSITIKTRKPLPVHVDAEPIGTTPVRIEVVPHCLSVVLPEHLPTHLFAER